MNAALSRHSFDFDLDSPRILVGCETSGVVRRAFASRGWDAWSCDMLPAEDRSNKHIVGDIRDYLDLGWDMLAVMHPPCTRLCNSGVRWLNGPPKNPPRDANQEEQDRWQQMSKTEKVAIMWRLLDEGAALFQACWDAPIPRVAVENPVMHGHARMRLSDDIPSPHYVQPYWFGERAKKATGFYLRGLSPLEKTDYIEPPEPGSEEDKKWSFVHRAPPGEERWKIRSRTFEGIASAMADQWGQQALEELQ